MKKIFVITMLLMGTSNVFASEKLEPCTIVDVNQVLKPILPVALPDYQNFSAKKIDLVGQEMTDATGEMVYNYKVILSPTKSNATEFDEYVVMIGLTDLYSTNKSLVCTLKSFTISGSAE